VTGSAYGLFHDTLADCTYDFGNGRSNYHGLFRSFIAEAGDVDYYMIAGPDIGGLPRRFTWLTGRPAFMPRWSLGYSGSTMSYTDAPDAQAQPAGGPVQTLHRPVQTLRATFSPSTRSIQVRSAAPSACATCS
jgi:alpha-glucosidase (family GH31 glycosyl hydrolase)